MTLDWILWITVALAQVALSVLAIRARPACKWFACYIYFATIQTFALLASCASRGIYFAIYFSGAVIGTILVLLIVGSLWRQVFGTPAALPLGTLTRFRTLVFSIVAPLCVILAGFFRARSLQFYFNSIINLETVVLSATGVTLALMVVYSKHLGISWRSKPAGIIGGFLWCFGVNWLVMFLAGREIVSIFTAQRLGQLAYLLALLLWARVLLEKERVPGKIADEAFQRVLHEFDLTEFYGARLRTRPTQT